VPPPILIRGAVSDGTEGRPIAGDSPSPLRRQPARRDESGPHTTPVRRRAPDGGRPGDPRGRRGGRWHLLGHPRRGPISFDVARTISDAVESVALHEPRFILDDSRPLVREDLVTELARSDRRDDDVAQFLGSGVGLPGEPVVAARLIRRGRDWRPSSRRTTSTPDPSRHDGGRARIPSAGGRSVNVPTLEKVTSRGRSSMPCEHWRRCCPTRAPTLAGKSHGTGRRCSPRSGGRGSGPALARVGILRRSTGRRSFAPVVVGKGVPTIGAERDRR
jgi:hypothetical protein